MPPTPACRMNMDQTQSIAGRNNRCVDKTSTAPEAPNQFYKDQATATKGGQSFLSDPPDRGHTRYPSLAHVFSKAGQNIFKDDQATQVISRDAARKANQCPASLICRILQQPGMHHVCSHSRTPLENLHGPKTCWGKFVPVFVLLTACHQEILVMWRFHGAPWQP
eukprot:366301-Chlamydomonas_euryale.AAC.32